ncbi:hypothetical protein D3C71_1900540 [compost metagenome]
MHPAHLSIGAAHTKDRLQAGHGQKGLPFGLAQAGEVFFQHLAVQHPRVGHGFLRRHPVEPLDGVAHVHELGAPIQFAHHLKQHAVGQVTPQQ